MKKLMILLACGLGLTVANAASVSWASGVGIKGVDSKAYLPAGDVKMYVFELASQEALDALDAEAISKLDVSTAALSGATTKSTAGITLADTTTYGASDWIYAAVLITQKDGDNTYYVAQKTALQVDGMGGSVAFSSLAKKVYGGGGADVTWTKGGGGDVPEPTSGLLLLLGVAGLALRRKAK